MLECVPEIIAYRECRSLLRIGKNTLLDLIHSREIEAFRIENR